MWRKNYDWRSRSRSRNESCNTSSRRYLPPPPDVRRIVQTTNIAARLGLVPDMTVQKENIPPTGQEEELYSQQQQFQESLDSGVKPISQAPVTTLPLNLQPLGTISATNTTLIGDRIIQCFRNPDSKWLVQVFPRATIQTITNRVVLGEITVMRRYIFLAIGANQVFRVQKQIICKEIKFLVLCILAKNPVTKVFISGVLPRLGKLHAKTYIHDFNRYLAAAIKKTQKEVMHMFYIPMQLQFQDPAEASCLFEQDLLRLNEFRRMRFKWVLMQGAGFISL